MKRLEQMPVLIASGAAMSFVLQACGAQQPYQPTHPVERMTAPYLCTSGRPDGGDVHVSLENVITGRSLQADQIVVRFVDQDSLPPKPAHNNHAEFAQLQGSHLPEYTISAVLDGASRVCKTFYPGQ